jgi:hypothetical protein
MVVCQTKLRPVYHHFECNTPVPQYKLLLHVYFINPNTDDIVKKKFRTQIHDFNKAQNKNKICRPQKKSTVYFRR